MSDNEIPLLSKSFSEDIKIETYCNANPSDPRCACVIPDPKIDSLLISGYNPYYCWYKGCLNSNTFKTSLILEGKKSCNIVLCEVGLDDVQIDENTNITVKNNCFSQNNFNSNIISQELLETSLNKKYEIPNIFPNTFFPLIIGTLVFLFLIR